MTDPLDDQIGRLERRVEELLVLCERLHEENRMLRDSQETLNVERAHLREKNEHARSRIEAMISRLKSMENH